VCLCVLCVCVLRVGVVSVCCACVCCVCTEMFLCVSGSSHTKSKISVCDGICMRVCYVCVVCVGVCVLPTYTQNQLTIP